MNESITLEDFLRQFTWNNYNPDWTPPWRNEVRDKPTYNDDGPIGFPGDRNPKSEFPFSKFPRSTQDKRIAREKRARQPSEPKETESAG